MKLLQLLSEKDGNFNPFKTRRIGLREDPTMNN